MSRRYARFYTPAPAPDARHKASGPAAFPGHHPARDDAIERQPCWLALARAGIADALASHGPHAGLQDSAITLGRLITLAELDDPPPMDLWVAGFALIARWCGPGGEVQAAVEGRAIILSAWWCMRLCPGAFFPHDGRGNAVSTRPVSGSAARLREGLAWASGRWGPGRVEVIAEAARGRLAV
jgi:hypothetical protein